jgi:hypothetical protein
MATAKPLPLPASEWEALAAKYGTPLQVYDEGAMRANARALLTRMGAAFPGFTQFFAVKALPNPAILRILIEASARAEVGGGGGEGVLPSPALIPPPPSPLPCVGACTHAHACRRVAA